MDQRTVVTEQTLTPSSDALACLQHMNEHAFSNLQVQQLPRLKLYLSLLCIQQTWKVIFRN